MTGWGKCMSENTALCWRIAVMKRSTGHSVQYTLHKGKTVTRQINNNNNENKPTTRSPAQLSMEESQSNCAWKKVRLPRMFVLFMLSAWFEYHLTHPGRLRNISAVCSDHLQHRAAQPGHSSHTENLRLEESGPDHQRRRVCDFGKIYEWDPANDCWFATVVQLFSVLTVDALTKETSWRFLN